MDFQLLGPLQSAVNFFVYNFIELAILFLGVSFFVEIVNLFLTPQRVQKILSSSKSGYIIASMLGSFTPFCSCSTIPLTLGLLKARAAFGPIMTFLFTSPLLNPIVIVVFWSAFGYKITLIYALIAFCVSILAGITLEKLGFKKYIKNDIFESEDLSKSCCTSKLNTTFTNIKPEKIHNNFFINTNILNNSNSTNESKFKQVFNKNIFIKTWKQFLSFVPYIAIGIGIGAFVHGFVPQELLTRYAGEDSILAIPVASIIGIPLYIRASSMVGLAPALIDGGVSMGAILALTVAGAGASLPEMIILKRIFKLPIMIFFIVCVFTMAIGCGYLVNYFL